jgi:hypothetical protein
VWRTFAKKVCHFGAFSLLAYCFVTWLPLPLLCNSEGVKLKPFDTNKMFHTSTFYARIVDFSQTTVSYLRSNYVGQFTSKVVETMDADLFLESMENGLLYVYWAHIDHDALPR